MAAVLCLALCGCLAKSRSASTESNGGSAGASGGSSARGGSVADGGSGAEGGSGASGDPVECQSSWECRADGAISACDPETARCVPPCGGQYYSFSGDGGVPVTQIEPRPCAEGEDCLLEYLDINTRLGACYERCDTEEIASCPAGFFCDQGYCRRPIGPGETCAVAEVIPDTISACVPGYLCVVGKCRAACDLSTNDWTCEGGELCYGSNCWSAEELGAIDANFGNSCPPDASGKPCASDGRTWRGMCTYFCGETCGATPVCSPFCQTDADCGGDFPYCSASPETGATGVCQPIPRPF
jgi:hypothetical protein